MATQSSARRTPTESSTPGGAGRRRPRASTRGAAGGGIEISGTGPDNPDDYSGIGKADAASGGGQWQVWAYTREGSPARMTAPTEPGEYTVRYFLQQDRFAIAEAPLIVE